MKVRLTRSHVMATGKKLPIGQIYGASLEEMNRLIKDNAAVEHQGDEQVLLREHKMKTDFFKPKK